MIRMYRPASLALISILYLLGGRSAEGQDQPAASASTFSQDQLEQLVAPIALYPDSLVSSVLMAATYPLEVVEADRWLDQNKSLTGDALDAALKGQDWDPSIKSIVTVPEVLKRMSTNLDWTRDLGDAFLAQQAAVMDAVQKMRGKANEAGNLKTTEQQAVTVQQDQTIVIEQTNPEVVYVPQYSTQVYGSGWGYPSSYYPSMYPPGWGLLGFGAGVIVGGALWGNCNWGWGHGNCDINVNRYNNFNNRVNNNWNNVSNKNWNHQVDHRKGVGYKNSDVAQKYGGAKGNNRVGSSDRARGRPSQQPAGGDRPGAGGAGNRPSQQPAGGDRPGAGGAGNRPSQQPAGGNRPGAGSSGAQRPSQQPAGGYSGSSQPRSDRAASNRGSSSRGYSGGGGGGGRSGGGGGGRGGGGGGRGGGGGGRR